jgi:hypothetical protein
MKHLATICDYLEIDFDMDLIIERWGKCIISEKVTLGSWISEISCTVAHIGQLALLTLST